MKDIKVIKWSNMPASFPVMRTILIALALDYWNAPEWLWGVCGVIVLITWIVCIVKIINQNEVDIFTEKEPETPSATKKSFMDKLEERMKNRDQ